MFFLEHHLANNKGLKGDIISSQANSYKIDLFFEIMF